MYCKHNKNPDWCEWCAQEKDLRAQIDTHRNAATAAYCALMLIAKGNANLSPQEVAELALGWERELNELLDKQTGGGT